MKRTCNISTEFEYADFEHDNFERYDFTKMELNPEDEGYSREEWNEQHQSSNEGLTKAEQDACFLEDFNDWVDENLSFEEQYEIPMMNAIRYYPSFCSFTEEQRQQVASNTTLFYDNDREQWAVGMTGGGMDLSPHLLDTFITLDSCVPEDIATAVSTGYSAYVDKDRHAENMRLVKEGLNTLGDIYKERANRI